MDQNLLSVHSISFHSIPTILYFRMPVSARRRAASAFVGIGVAVCLVVASLTLVQNLLILSDSAVGSTTFSSATTRSVAIASTLPTVSVSATATAAAAAATAVSEGDHTDMHSDAVHVGRSHIPHPQPPTPTVTKPTESSKSLPYLVLHKMDPPTTATTTPQSELEMSFGRHDALAADSDTGNVVPSSNSNNNSNTDTSSSQQ
jgi:hypothetical protein